VSSKVYIDGEQIPDDRIREIFRRPPDLPSSFERSALIVGSRGAGKTTLFRFLKVSHEGTPIHLALAGELATFAQDAALGPLGVASSDLQAQVAKKANSILAVSLAARFLRRRLKINRDLLQDCLPKAHFNTPRRPTHEWCRNTLDHIASLDLHHFSYAHVPRTLARFVASAAEQATSKGTPLLLLLDRADMVVPAALRPVAELMDQSIHYIALVAMRPGHAATIFSSEELGPVAGDHFAVIHMGSEAYSPDWQQFLDDAVSAQLGGLSLAALSDEIKQHIFALSRDSLRTALELLLASRDAAAANLEKALSRALRDLRENQIVASQRVLQGTHPDYRRLIGHVRKIAADSRGHITGPVQVRIEQRAVAGLWEENSRVDDFINSALRSRAACMPNGKPWAPGIRIREIEIPPIALWSEGDPHWSGGASTSLIDLPEGELFAAGGPRERRHSIFVAYRMAFDKSTTFRRQIEDILKRQPLGHKIDIVDGRVRTGEDWAPTIRRRIERSRLVVGDLTGLRNDVLFELGFAYGLRKRVIPVTESAEARNRVPHWLLAKQIGLYETEAQLVGVVSHLLAFLTDRYAARPVSSPDPTLGLAVWLDFEHSLAPARDQFAATCEREGFFVEIAGPGQAGEELVHQGTRAHLLVAPLTGRESDAMVHFICGAIVARPQVGYGSTLRRRIALLCPNGNVRGYAADSLLRCTQTVLTPDPHAVHSVVLEEAATYRRLLQSNDVPQSAP
jgi:hypothetical protein